MDNGRDLIEMVVSSYETPDDEVDDDGGHDYSAPPLHACSASSWSSVSMRECHYLELRLLAGRRTQLQ